MEQLNVSYSCFVCGELYKSPLLGLKREFQKCPKCREKLVPNSNKKCPKCGELLTKRLNRYRKSPEYLSIYVDCVCGYSSYAHEVKGE